VTRCLPDGYREAVRVSRTRSHSPDVSGSAFSQTKFETPRVASDDRLAGDAVMGQAPHL